SSAGRVEPSDLRDGMTLEIRWIDATDRFGEYDLPSSVHPLHGAEGLGARISRHREAVNRRTIARWTRLSFCRSHGFAVLRRCVGPTGAGSSDRVAVRWRPPPPAQTAAR